MPSKATKFTTAGSRNHTNLEEKQWIHRIANELKANRQWTQKWQLLNDATLFSDEAAPKYPQKLANTSWSEWSVLNPPDPGVIINKRKPKAVAHFKITGNRDRYLSNNKPSATYLKQDPVSGIADKSVRPTPVFNQSIKTPVTSNREYGFFLGLPTLEQFSTRRV